MSGGKERKSRASKTQGWEEAGAEFYQESYPADWEGLQRDPAAIATLLPSKQNRVATTRRVRSTNQDTKGTRRRQQTTIRRRNSTSRRGSQYHESHVAMLPDLSQGTDEERIWEEIHEIKTMPVSMAQKKEMKAQLQNATKLRLQGLDQIKWQQRKVWQQFETKWNEFLIKMELWRNSLKKIEGNFGTGVVAYFLFLRWLMILNLITFILILSFIVIPQIILIEPKDKKCIDTDNINSIQCCSENYFNNTINEITILDILQGTGLMEKTLMFYGMYTNKIFGYHPYDDKKDNNNNDKLEYFSTTNITTSTITNDSSQQSLLNDNLINNNKNNDELYYDLPLAYVSITAVYFLLSLAAIVKAASHEFKDRLIDGEGQFYQYCNLIFGGWDFCIHNEKSADIKHKALYNEIKSLLQSKRMEYERHNRSKDFMFKLIIIRFIVNIFVLIILILSALFIYVLFNISLKYLQPNFQNLNDPTLSIPIMFDKQLQQQQQQQQQQQYQHNNNIINDSFISSLEKYNNHESLQKIHNLNTISTTVPQQEQFVILFYEFLPYIAIVGLNFLIPTLFNYLVQFEQYSPMFVIKITLLRTVFLRLSSLAVLLSRFYFLIIPTKIDNNGNDDITATTTTSSTITLEKCTQSSKPQCWETFVGQQFYKLLITDFVTHIIVTFLVNFPRAILAKHINIKFIRFIGEQEFELSKHVLDIVYSQTLCWLGSFYAPFLPALSTIYIFFMFYIKKFACLINSKPSTILYRASRSKSLFMFILLLSFGISIIPVVYAIAEIIPSRSCGPYRGLNSVWDSAILAFMKLPKFLQNCIFFLGTAGFAIPCFVILTLFLYYYYAVSDANKHMVIVLKNQLVLEGHDKQFLLNRLSSFIKQHQEYQKKLKRCGDEQREQREQRRERNNDRNTTNKIDVDD